MGGKERKRGKGKEREERQREIVCALGCVGRREKESKRNKLEGETVEVSGKGDRRRKKEHSSLKNNRCIDN